MHSLKGALCRIPCLEICSQLQLLSKYILTLVNEAAVTCVPFQASFSFCLWLIVTLMLFFSQNILDRLWPSVAFQTLNQKTVWQQTEPCPFPGFYPTKFISLIWSLQPWRASGEKQGNDACLYDPGLSLSVRGWGFPHDVEPGTFWIIPCLHLHLGFS